MGTPLSKNAITDWRPLVRHVRVTDRLSHVQEWGYHARYYYGDSRHDTIGQRRKKRLIVARTANGQGH